MKTPEQIYAALAEARCGSRDWPKAGSQFAQDCIQVLSGELRRERGEPTTNLKLKRPKLVMTDEQWVISLEGEPSLKGINVRQEIGKCQFWCRTNQKLPTRRRIVNWLNKAERVTDLKAQGAQYANGLRPVPPVQPEPANWRDAFPDFVDVGKPWPSLRPEQRAFILTELTAQNMTRPIKEVEGEQKLRRA